MSGGRIAFMLNLTSSESTDINADHEISHKTKVKGITETAIQCNMMKKKSRICKTKISPIIKYNMKAMGADQRLLDTAELEILLKITNKIQGYKMRSEEIKRNVG